MTAIKDTHGKTENKQGDPYNLPSWLSWRDEQAMVQRGRKQAEPRELHVWAELRVSWDRDGKSSQDREKRCADRESKIILQRTSLGGLSRVLISTCVWRNFARHWRELFKAIWGNSISSSHRASYSACPHQTDQQNSHSQGIDRVQRRVL